MLVERVVDSTLVAVHHTDFSPARQGVQFLPLSWIKQLKQLMTANLRLQRRIDEGSESYSILPLTNPIAC
jgi:hypothetical protein